MVGLFAGKKTTVPGHSLSPAWCPAFPQFFQHPVVPRLPFPFSTQTFATTKLLTVVRLSKLLLPRNVFGTEAELHPGFRRKDVGLFIDFTATREFLGQS